MPPTGAKSSPKNQIDHTHLHSFVADLPLAMKTAGALNQTAVDGIPFASVSWWWVIFTTKARRHEDTKDRMV
jgi:hypothetical protein